ncbi:MAG: hypothetical protein RIQ81_2608 [Pseudomonadota bacterium]
MSSRSGSRIAFFLLVSSLTAFLFACGPVSETSMSAKLAAIDSNGRYPTTPDHSLTPGSKCDSPDTYRYPEKVPYCNRDVESSRKAAIFVRYDRELGFETTKMDRQSFKIDHYIPLCMGGSNDDSNLWPQHSTVYEHTDPAEGYLCERMKEGRLLQAKAIEIIREIKANPERSASVLPDAY